MSAYAILSEKRCPQLISSTVSSRRAKLDPPKTKICPWVCAGISGLSLSQTYAERTSSLCRELHRFGRHCALLQGNIRVKSVNPSGVRVLMDSDKTVETTGHSQAELEPMKVLFVEMGVGYDQHGQDITAAAMRACRDAISSNSIPAFRTGAVPGVNFNQMKLKIKLGVPHSTQGSLDIERVKSVFPYGDIIGVEVVDGGLVCSSGVCLEAMGDQNDDCYIVNAAVYVGY